jgi:asparagine synthase (glutamine-hydrolysing)
MCGFAGILSFGRLEGESSARRRLLEAMGNAIAHRGPDDAEYYDDGVLALVFRRLSIIDIAGGRQPIQSESGDLLLVANGEIYNHRELRRALEPRHTFRTASDCEVPLHAYEEWGASSFERLAGMFALALWDRQAKRLLLARDRLGIKPLYVCRLPDGLLFGSELKALLMHPRCPRDLDWRVLDRTRSGQPPETSYVRSIDMLPGGQWISAGVDGMVSQHRYWRLEDHMGTASLGHDAQSYTDRYADLLEQVVHEHLLRDVGAGLMLSGGVDSSLLAAIIGRHEARFPCVTVVERTPLLEGDTAAARALTQTLEMPWHPLRFDFRTVVGELDLGLDRLEQFVWMMDSPRLDLEWIFKAEAQRALRVREPDLKVLILGQGADEFAGGYSRRLDAPYADWSQYLRDEVMPNLVHLEAEREGGTERLWPLMRERTPARRGIGPYHRMMELFIGQLQHHNLWHEDRTSSWHSLEARVPFLDHRLVELLASVPEDLHETLFWSKGIVRSALERFMPGHPLRQTKIGFIDSHDDSSVRFMLRAIVQKSFGAFRERYLHEADCPFDADKIEALARRVFLRGPTLLADSQQLLECMAVAIFQRQCRTPAAAAAAAARTVASAPQTPRVIADQDWPALERALRHVGAGSAWQLDEVVELREGVEICAPVRPAHAERYCVLLNGGLAGELNVNSSLPWLAPFLRNLGTAATREFSVRDWIEEFEIDGQAFVQVLDVLCWRGVIQPPRCEQPPPDAHVAMQQASAAPKYSQADFLESTL